ncbi:MAG: NAAT family transporter [Methylotenera sp.]|nr:NAAT family transporter [Methylotenera sp.]MSQ00138.1 NAAT family transporter [Methylotenera sp.]
MDWAYLFKIGIALFAIVNPIGSVPIFISATDGWNSKEKLRTANVVAVTVFLVLVASALFGDGILNFFSITIPSFQVGGGILILLIAINMLHAKQSHSKQTPEEAKTMEERDVIAVVPLSIPLLAGPGAIGSMIIAAQQSKTFIGHISLVVPILVVACLVWVTLQLSSYIADKLGTIGINIVTRLMGLILAAMAVEFIAHGVIGLFPALEGR